MTRTAVKEATATISTAAFKSVVSEAGKFVSSGGALPMLQCVLVETAAAIVRVSATNMQAFYRREIEAEGDIGLAGIAVPFSILDKTLAGFDDEMDITLSFPKGKALRLAGGQVEAEIKGLPDDDFPAIALSGGEVRCSVTQRDLARLISVSAPCAASGLGHGPMLEGCSIEIVKGMLSCFATDSHRLGGTSVSVEAEPWAVVLPARDLKTLSRLLDDSEDLVEIASIGPGIVAVRFGGTTVGLRVVDGQYPAWRKLIPLSSTTVASACVDRTDLIGGIRLAAVYGRGKDIDLVRIAFSPEGLTVSSDSQERGSGMTRIASSAVTGTEKLAINAQVALPLIEQVSSTDILIETHGSTSPVILRDLSDKHFIGLVMPVRVPGE